MTKGKFIVIDGTDGSGKKTQANILIKRLKKLKYETALFDFPQYYSSFFGKMVGRYLKGEFGKLADISPYLASLLYAGDRWQAKEKISQNLNEGKIVVTNRYVPSNLAYQGAKLPLGERQKFFQWLEDLEYRLYQIPKEHLVIFLYVPVEIGQGLVDNKGHRKYLGGRKRDIHEENLSYLKKVEKLYQEFCQKRKNWQLISCTKNGQILSREKIAEKIWDIVSRKLNLR